MVPIDKLGKFQRWIEASIVRRTIIGLTFGIVSVPLMLIGALLSIIYVNTQRGESGTARRATGDQS